MHIYFPSFGKTILLAVFFVLFAISVNAGTQTIRGQVSHGGVPKPNFTFLYERHTGNFTTEWIETSPVTTDHLGNYSVVFDNCFSWPGNVYAPRVALAGGGSVLLQGFHNSFSCGDVNWDISISSGTQLQDGSRYNAGETSCSVGAPVNVTNGNMWLKQTDYQLAGFGGGLNVTRIYNSVTQESGLFGYGWSSAFDTRLLTVLTPQNQSFIQLDFGNGQLVNFVKYSNGLYPAATHGFLGQITLSGSDYLLTWKDGRSSKFSDVGRRLWEKDRNGNQTTFAYDTNNNLASITDPFGRIVKVISNTNGTVHKICDGTGTDPCSGTGTIATYEYEEPATTKLTSVTYGDGSKYKYEYDTTSAPEKYC